MVALSDTSEDIVERYEYDVFGEPNRISDVNNPYMFTGRRLDTETGLYYYRARYYQPDIGRFLQTDPIGYEDGLNLYTYVHNNPVNWLDPYGLAVKCTEKPVRGYANWEVYPWSPWTPWIGYTMPDFGKPPGFMITIRIRERFQFRNQIWYRIWEIKCVDECGNTSISRYKKREGILASQYRKQRQHQTLKHFRGRIYFRGKIITSAPTPWLS